jgi:hypothetical protein
MQKKKCQNAQLKQKMTLSGVFILLGVVTGVVILKLPLSFFKKHALLVKPTINKAPKKPFNDLVIDSSCSTKKQFSYYAFKQ